MRIRLLNKSKSKSYAESFAVNVAGRWRERLRSYLGRPVRYAPDKRHEICHRSKLC